MPTSTMYPDWALLNDDDYKSGTANQAGGLNEVDYFRCNDEEAETPQLGSAPEYMYLPRLNSLLKTKTSLGPIYRLFVKGAITKEIVANKYATQSMNSEYQSAFLVHHGVL